MNFFTVLIISDELIIIDQSYQLISRLIYHGLDIDKTFSLDYRNSIPRPPISASFSKKSRA